MHWDALGCTGQLRFDMLSVIEISAQILYCHGLRLRGAKALLGDI